MNNEPQEIALRYKGEDYKDCKVQLSKDGFQPKGFNEWYSPITRNTYRFVLAEGGAGYVTRIELMSDNGPKLITTEFYDHKMALSRYNIENTRSSANSLDDALERFKDSLLSTSLSKVLRLIESEKEEGNPDAALITESIGTNEKGKLVIKNYLFYNGIVCFYSPTRRPTHKLLNTIEHNGNKLYLYKARIYIEDLLESLISKTKLVRILGEEAVRQISETNIL